MKTKTKKNDEKLLYQTNKVSYIFGYLGILFNVVFLFLTFNTVDLKLYSLPIGIKIFANIIVLLITFLSIEKVKYYSIKYSIYQIFLGLITIGRLFWLPRLFFQGKYVVGKYMESYQSRAFLIGSFLALAGIMFLLSGIIGLLKALKIKNLKKVYNYENE